MRKNADKILLFVPMYNCEKQIVRVLRQLTPAVCEYLTEVILVNNRSTDRGEDAVIRFLTETPPAVPVRLLRNDENYGLGGSHKVAFRYALLHDFDYVIVLHGDDQGTIADLMPYLADGSYRAYDCFLGARFMAGAKLQGYSLFRTFGNRVYNLLFSAGCGMWVKDLGAGLNMYRTAILRDEFYLKFKDNLVFNYCMIMASAHLRHAIRFFPITWREEDQVSNVKLMSQAMTVLRLLWSFVCDKRAFLRAEHRDEVRTSYTAQVVHSTEAEGRDARCMV